MSEANSSGVAEQVDVRIRQLGMDLAKVYVAALLVRATFYVIGGVSADAPEVELELSEGESAALLAVIAAVAVQLLVAAPQSDGRPRSHPRAAELAYLFALLGFACAFGAALVGWSIVLSTAPDSVHVAGVLWFGASVMVALIALAVTWCLPDDAARSLARVGHLRRLRWLRVASAHWRSGKERRGRTVRLKPNWRSSVAGVVALIGMPLIFLGPHQLLAGREPWVDLGWVIVLWSLTSAFLLVTVAGYVVRSWLWFVMSAGMALYVVSVLLLAAALDVASATHPWLAGIAWSALLAGSAILAVWTVLAPSSRFAVGMVGVSVSTLLRYERVRAVRAIRPPCTCGRPLRFAHFREKHAALSGRPWPPESRCKQHRKDVGS